MYNTNLLNSVAECDTLLNMASTEQANLEFRKSNIEHRAASYASNAVEIDADILATQAELDAVNTTISVLSDGDAKTDYIIKQKRLEAQMLSLTKRKKNVSNVAVLDSELEVVKLDKEIDAVKSFITEVQTRKSQL